MAAPDARPLSREGGSPSGAQQAGAVHPIRSPVTALLGPVRHCGLENPLLPLPAVLTVAVGFFVPLAVLVLYSFWPTENGRIVHQWTMANYVRFFTERAYWQMLLRSFWLVALASALTVLLSFPFAY